MGPGASAQLRAVGPAEQQAAIRASLPTSNLDAAELLRLFSLQRF
jgi:hypothetical protein